MKNYLFGLFSLLIVFLITIPVEVEAQNLDVSVAVVDVYSSPMLSNLDNSALVARDVVVYSYGNLTHLQSDRGSVEVFSYTYNNSNDYGGTTSQEDNFYNTAVLTNSDYHIGKLLDITDNSYYNQSNADYEQVVKDPYRHQDKPISVVANALTSQSIENMYLFRQSE